MLRHCCVPKSLPQTGTPSADRDDVVSQGSSNVVPAIGCTAPGQLGIQRQLEIFLMELHEGRGGGGPDSCGRTTAVPTGTTEPIRSFDPFYKAIEGSLGRQHGHLDCEYVVTTFSSVPASHAE